MGDGETKTLLPTVIVPPCDSNRENGNHPRSSYDSVSKDSNAYNDDEFLETNKSQSVSVVAKALQRIPAVLVLALWNIMLSVPFGSTFFSRDVPLSNATKEKLGMRMAMLALGVGQWVYGGCLTGFEALTLWELAEVAPFYKDFAKLAATHGDHPDETTIYSTTVYLISLSTIAVGGLFFLCGYFRVGQLLNFFPSYVTLGVVGGIGVWAVTMSMTISASPHIFNDQDANVGWWDYAMTPQFGLSLLLGLGIRPLRKVFPDFLLLDPLYYLSIPIVFHLVLALIPGIDFETAVQEGYVFQEPTTEGAAGAGASSIWEESAELWTRFDFTKVSWEVAFQAAPQMFAAAILSVMITSPFIPPIATLGENSSKSFSPDREFMAHGVANAFSALVAPGGVPICACYSSTVLYVNSGGGGGFSNLLLSLTSVVSFVYGPVLAGYLPRCMASSILIDMGIALFLEGVGDNESHKCNPVEYTSIWVILTVMTVLDMTSGLIAGLVMALFTSTYSNAHDFDPVRRVCDAGTFPSSRRRNRRENEFLEHPLKGRTRILVFQLQGSLFFGNISKVQDRLFEVLDKRREEENIVIFDCTLVSSLDSSACVFFDKIQSTLQNEHGVLANVFVASPAKLGLEKAAVDNASSSYYIPKAAKAMAAAMIPLSNNRMSNRRTSLARPVEPAMAFSKRPSCDSNNTQGRRRSSTMTTRGSYGSSYLTRDIRINGICFDYLDKALASCEDKLLTLGGIPLSVNVMGDGNTPTTPRTPTSFLLPQLDLFANDDPDRAMALEMLKQYCNTEKVDLLQNILSVMKQETLSEETVVWNLGDPGSCARLFLKGSVFAYVLDDGDDKRFHSKMAMGSFLGLRSLILDENHLATVRCDESSVFYSLDKEGYDTLVKKSPKAARLLELSMARYLSHRLNHVSNRIYQSRSLPI